MRFGYFTLTDNPPGYGAKRRDASRFLLEVMEECLHAEEIGLNSVWVPEHDFSLFGCLPSPAVFLANVAAKTTRVKLAPATVLLPCNHPIRVAEEFALLDLLSQGRVVFSAGRGYDKREYDAFGIPFEESRERFDEEMEIIQKAWAEKAFTYKGKFFQFDEPMTILPRPVQRPHPPIYVACFSKPTVEMAARFGFNTLFAPFAAAMMFGSVQQAAAYHKDRAAEAGYPNVRAMCSYFVAVVDSPAQALAAKERLLFYLRSIIPALPGDRTKAPLHIAYFADIIERLQAMQPEQLGDRSIITGSPEECVESLKKVEAAGIEEVILYFNFGAYPHQDTMKMMDRFVREVAPHFDGGLAA
jgi:alkanesulfonate monooxygenase SsuD/methylene tetrahydromethanopterin reductase-like flavin-dependent oxidoreductase (luciferase family)